MTALAATMTGGDLLAATLKKAGVDRTFVLHGGHLEALFHGLIDHEIEMLDFRHEASAGHAADAYARVTGKLGVCIVTAGPGFTNAISAMTNAQLDGSPVLFIIGAPPLREQETNELQGGFDQVALARPAVKWAVRVNATERMADVAAMAIRRAMTGRKGVVLLEVPIDILHLPASSARATPPAGVNVRPRPAPAPDELDAMLALLAAAKRPVIVAGMEAGFSADDARFRRFADATGIPVVFKAAAEGLLHFEHPLHAGPSGILDALGPIGRERPDVVLLFGARMGMWLAGRSGALIPHDAKLIQVAADAGEIGRLRDVDVAIAADMDSALDAMLAKTGQHRWADRGAWIADLAAARAASLGSWPESDLPDGMHPFHAIRAVVATAGPDAAYAIDGGESVSWSRDAIQLAGPRRVAAPGYLGCLGVGPGFAIGLQVAHPGRRVVLLTGDGAWGFHLQELDTMVRKNLPVVVVVMNNRVWGMSLHGQQIMYGPNYSAVSRLGDTNYADIARAFGCFSQQVSTCAEIGPAMEAAFASGKPAVIELLLADVAHPRTAAALGKTDDGSVVTIPYYENVPVNPLG